MGANPDSRSRDRGAVLGDINQLNFVSDFEEPSLDGIIQRLQASYTLEHLIYRESEMDEVWRLVEAALREARHQGRSTELIEVLEGLRAAVVRVHDLIGVEDDAESAALELRRSVFLARKYATLVKR